MISKILNSIAGYNTLMCGRFAASLDYPALAKRYHALLAPGLPKPSWNIFPGATVALIAEDIRGNRHLHPARWNLIPSWSSSSTLPYPTHNARVEGVLDKPTYAESAGTKRAIIPASGYYEWNREHIPYYFQTRRGEPLAIAGLYSWWRQGQNSPWILTTTILTTQAEGDPLQVHDRMPLLITEENINEWLDPTEEGGDILSRAVSIGRLASAELIQHQVAPLKGDGPQLIEDVVLRS